MVQYPKCNCTHGNVQHTKNTMNSSFYEKYKFNFEPDFDQQESLAQNQKYKYMLRFSRSKNPPKNNVY